MPVTIFCAFSGRAYLTQTRFGVFDWTTSTSPSSECVKNAKLTRLSSVKNILLALSVLVSMEPFSCGAYVRDLGFLWGRCLLAALSHAVWKPKLSIVITDVHVKCFSFVF